MEAADGTRSLCPACRRGGSLHPGSRWLVARRSAPARRNRAADGRMRGHSTRDIGRVRQAATVVTSTVRALIAGRYRLVVYCPCGHHAWLDLIALARRDGPDTPTDHWSMRRRLRCSQCGRRSADVKLHVEGDSRLGDRPYTEEERSILAASRAGGSPPVPGTEREKGSPSGGL